MNNHTNDKPEYPADIVELRQRFAGRLDALDSARWQLEAALSSNWGPLQLEDEGTRRARSLATAVKALKEELRSEPPPYSDLTELLERLVQSLPGVGPAASSAVAQERDDMAALIASSRTLTWHSPCPHPDCPGVSDLPARDAAGLVVQRLGEITRELRGDYDLQSFQPEQALMEEPCPDVPPVVIGIGEKPGTFSTTVDGVLVRHSPGFGEATLPIMRRLLTSETRVLDSLDASYLNRLRRALAATQNRSCVELARAIELDREHNQNRAYRLRWPSLLRIDIAESDS